jgi:hypothetical protein
MASIISAGTTSGTALNMAGDTSGVLELATNGSTTAITIDTSQKVGIGTASPDALLTVNTIASFGDGAVGTPSIAHKGDLNTGIFFSAADTIDFAEGGVACGQFDSSGNFKFNSGYGSVETAYGCRAWVNFNGEGTVAIRGSGNVTSITDNGTGNYTVNFTNAMPDANYNLVGSAGGGNSHPVNATAIAHNVSPTTTACRVYVANPGGTGSVGFTTDAVQIGLSFFR